MWKKVAVLAISAVINLSCISKYALRCDLESVVRGGVSFRACEGNISRQLVDEFQLVAEVKDFGKRVLGMEKTDNYTEYRSGKDDNLIDWMYTLYIMPKDIISMKSDYRYLDKDESVRDDFSGPAYLSSIKDNLRDEYGFYEGSKDLFYRVNSDYVLDGKGCDMTDSFIDSPVERKVELILHEDWHVNHKILAHRAVDSAVSESTASFVGVFGAVEFAKEKYGEKSWAYKQALQARDSWMYHAYITNESYRKLSEIYSMDIPFEEKMELKSKLLDEIGAPYSNNASIAYDYAYTKYFPDIFRIYLSQDKDFVKTVDILKKVPPDDSDAERFLKDY